MLHGTLVAVSLSVTCLRVLFCVCLSFITLNWFYEMSQNLFLLQDLRATQKGMHNGNTTSEFICLESKILHCFLSLFLLITPHPNENCRPVETILTLILHPTWNRLLFFSTSSLWPSSNYISSNMTS